MDFENLYERMDDPDYSGLDRNELEEQLVNPLARAMPDGYWYADRSWDKDDNPIYEFITSNGPKIEVRLILMGE